jgi:hypothetical protein
VIASRWNVTNNRHNRPPAARRSCRAKPLDSAARRRRYDRDFEFLTVRSWRLYER